MRHIFYELTCKLDYDKLMQMFTNPVHSKHFTIIRSSWIEKGHFGFILVGVNRDDPETWEALGYDTCYHEIGPVDHIIL